MIKVGITGGETLLAGELLRILVFHPDVKLLWVQSATATGAVSLTHRGLTGETDLAFTRIVGEPADVVFVCAPCIDLTQLGEAKIVDVSGEPVLESFGADSGSCVYGLSEMNRKHIVRDCTGTVVPSPIAMAALVPLLPLARNGLLKDGIVVTCEAGHIARQLRSSTSKSEIELALKKLQPNYGGPVEVKVTESSHTRALNVTVSMRFGISGEQLHKLYDDYFEDHNFVFLIDRKVDHTHVANTNKCLLHIENDNGTLVVNSYIDPLIKGGAGTAVHDMNLLFKLHERAGLMLKASVF